MVVDQTVRNWLTALRPAAKERRWRFISDTPYVIGDDHVTAVEIVAMAGAQPGDRPRLVWSVVIKPTVVDDVLWEAFLPGVEIGARARSNRRINGAFRVPPLEIGRGERVIALREPPDWGPLFDEFDAIRTRHLTTHPGLDDFITASEADRNSNTGRRLVRTITALIAADRPDEAKTMAEEALARGETGLMSSRADVLEHLAAHAAGPESFAEFRRSLEPTHTFEVLSDTERDIVLDLAEARNRGRFGHHLASMDGANPWAIILSTMTEAVDEMSYLQAAGTAESMIVEWCRPTEGEHVAVRSVLGHPDHDPAPNLKVVTPHGGIEILGRESFTATEAAALFEEFYHHGTIDGNHLLRPVQGFFADGGSVDLT